MGKPWNLAAPPPTRRFDLYTTSIDFGTGAITLSAATPIDTSGAYPKSDRPLMVSVGDFDGDGCSDLFSIVSTSTGDQLWANMGHAFTTSVFHGHALVDDSNLWSHITDIN